MSVNQCSQSMRYQQAAIIVRILKHMGTQVTRPVSNAVFCGAPQVGKTTLVNSLLDWFDCPIPAAQSDVNEMYEATDQLMLVDTPGRRGRIVSLSHTIDGKHITHLPEVRNKARCNKVRNLRPTFVVCCVSAPTMHDMLPLLKHVEHVCDNQVHIVVALTRTENNAPSNFSDDTAWCQHLAGVIHNSSKRVMAVTWTVDQLANVLDPTFGNRLRLPK